MFSFWYATSVQAEESVNATVDCNRALPPIPGIGVEKDLPPLPAGFDKPESAFEDDGDSVMGLIGEPVDLSIGENGVPLCGTCGAWQAYDGHCSCVELARDFGGPEPRWRFQFSGDGTFQVVPAPPMPPYDKRGCYMWCFDVDEHERMRNEVDLPDSLSIAGITNLSREYRLSTIPLDISKVADGKYHLVPSDSARSRPWSAWLNEIYSPGGLFSKAKYGTFGMAYSAWDVEGEVGRLGRGSWVDIYALSRAVAALFESPFSKQSHRDALHALLTGAVRRNVVSGERRFPARGAFAAMSQSSWDVTMRQLIGAAAYKDYSKDDKAKERVEETGTVREQDYGDALVSMGKGVAAMLQALTRQSGIYNRESFEKRFSLSWRGEDDSIISVWNNYDGRASAVSSMPWFNTVAVDELIGELNQVNPALNADLAKICLVVNKAMAMRAPYSKNRLYPNVGVGAYNVSICAGDWAGKFAKLFLVAGYYDGQKDAKFKKGQNLPEDKKNDRSDMMQQFRTALTDIDNQYAQHTWFTTNASALTRWLGIVPKKDTKPPAPPPPPSVRKAHVIAELRRRGHYIKTFYADYDYAQGQYVLGKKVVTSSIDYMKNVMDLDKNEFLVDESASTFYYYEGDKDKKPINEKEIPLALRYDGDEEKDQEIEEGFFGIEV